MGQPQKWYQKATVQSAFVATIGAAITALIPVFLGYFHELPKIKQENNQLHQEITENLAEIQRLETLLTPFKTIALERYTGTEAEVLSKLAFRLHDVESFIAILQNYSKVAELDFRGLPAIRTEGGLTISTPLSKLLEGAVSVDGNQVHFECEDSYIQQYFSIIQERPDFPFTYYVIALCYKKQGREEWKQYAQKAILILEKTTQIDGHHGFHDEALSQLLLLVRE